MGSYASSVMDDSDSGSRTEDSDQETELANILQYLIRSGQVRIISSDYEDDDVVTPPPAMEYWPNTSSLEQSEITLATKQASGMGVPKRNIHVNKSLTSMIDNRERGMFVNNNFSRGDKCKIANNFLPNKMKVVAKYDGKAFCGTYSKNGDCFVSACQDYNIRLYRTDRGQFELFNTIQARDVGWSIIDTAFSPDGQYLVYSSWSESLHLCRLDGDSETQEALPLCPEHRRFCMFSVMFSSDGKEILGGANDGHIYVYDRECNQRTLRIEAHDDDANTVAFADDTSQILYSGGDDGLAKVWDRRTLNEQDPKPVGVLAGHMDGITYIDSRGDGRYLISNSKDQSIKLWDIRLFSGSEGQNNTKKAVNKQAWDYRWQDLPSSFYYSKPKLKGDTSVMTYQGHSILKTLVRCHFSPAETTGQKYIYTGCAAGRVIIYDVLTGKEQKNLRGHRSCVRDVSWHPYRQEIVSTSWDGKVGKWTYAGLEPDDPENFKTIKDFYSDEKHRPETLRRSERIASQRQRQNQQNNC